MTSTVSNQVTRRCTRSLQGLAGMALALAMSCSVAHAGQSNERDDSEPTADAHGNINKKIGHRLADWVQTISPFGSLGNNHHAALPPVGATTAAAAPITYHGGPVMPSLSKIVVIWYGNWAQSNATDTAAGQQIILDALYGLAATPGVNDSNYSGITTGAASTLGVYSQSGGSFASAVSSPTLIQITQPASSTYGGTTLTDSSVLNLVKNNAGATADPNAIYLVLSSSNINESSGFLTKYCGWHSYSNKIASGKSIKYAFVGNPNKSLGSCSYQTASSPNNNPAVDAMISVIAHELMETVSDPQLNAWYNSGGSENGDMCGWTFGTTQTALSNGSYYNVSLPARSGGSRPYLLQRALASRDSKCYINATGSVQ